MTAHLAIEIKMKEQQYAMCTCQTLLMEYHYINSHKIILSYLKPEQN